MILNANSIQIPLRDKSVQLCAFSPPYWGLRKYEGLPEIVWGGVEGCRHEWVAESKLPTRNRNNDGEFDRPCRQELLNPGAGSTCALCHAWLGDLGLEPTVEMYLDHMMLVMAEVWRVLKPDGVCFTNIGDAYARDAKKGQHKPGDSGKQAYIYDRGGGHASAMMDLKTSKIRAKSLCLIPQKFAIRCQEAGWIIRSEIIWAKPNPMPESVKDRPTKSHEQIWMMTKQGRYFWDADAIKEPCSDGTHARYARGRSANHKWADGGPGNQTIAKGFAHMGGIDIVVPKSYKGSVPGRQGGPGQGRRGKGDRVPGVNPKATQAGWRTKQNPSFSAACKDIVETRNIRSVWVINPEPTPEAHFASWPTKLCERMILAASKPGDIVLDPFCGTGKTVNEAERLSRIGIGLDLSMTYLAGIAAKKLALPLQKELVDFSLDKRETGW